MKIGSIYQVKIGNAVSSYTYDEIEIKKVKENLYEK